MSVSQSGYSKSIFYLSTERKRGNRYGTLEEILIKQFKQGIQESCSKQMSSRSWWNNSRRRIWLLKENKDRIINQIRKENINLTLWKEFKYQKKMVKWEI